MIKLVKNGKKIGVEKEFKLAFLEWRNYDLEVDHFSMVKYADDTSFYTTIRDPQTESIALAVI